MIKTPLYAEDLLEILSKRSMGIAGYNGTCERFIRYDTVVERLHKLISDRAQASANTRGEVTMNKNIKTWQERMSDGGYIDKRINGSAGVFIGVAGKIAARDAEISDLRAELESRTAAPIVAEGLWPKQMTKEMLDAGNEVILDRCKLVRAYAAVRAVVLAAHPVAGSPAEEPKCGLALDAAIHKVLIAGGDCGDELSDHGLRNTLKEAQHVAYRALISIGVERLPGAVNTLHAFLPKDEVIPAAQSVRDAAQPTIAAGKDGP